MGLSHSAALSDLAFLTLGEGWALRPGTLRGCRITLYARFRDDLIIVGDSRDGMRMFSRSLMHRVRDVYRLVCTEVSKEKVEMCAVDLRMCGRHIIATPKFRPAGTILGHDSSHQVKVHHRWPSSYARSLVNLCTLPADEKRHQLKFVQRMRVSGAPLSRIHTVLRALEHPQIRRNTAVEPVLWCVLPWHADLEPGQWNRVASAFARHPVQRELWSDAFSDSPSSNAGHIRLSWKLETAKILDILRS